MIRKSAIALILAAAGVGAAPSAFGQYNDRGYDGQGDENWRGGRLPGGSWQQSCTNARMRGPMMRARCQDTSGNWRYTELDVRNCRRGFVSNSNGRLVCGESGWNNNGGWGGNWGNGRLPGGSWGASCREGNMNGTVLFARCDSGNGGWYSSQLDMRQCYSNRARNSYGRLECE